MQPALVDTNDHLAVTIAGNLKESPHRIIGFTNRRRSSDDTLGGARGTRRRRRSNRRRSFILGFLLDGIRLGLANDGSSIGTMIMIAPHTSNHEHDGGEDGQERVVEEHFLWFVRQEGNPSENLKLIRARVASGRAIASIYHHRNDQIT